MFNTWLKSLWQILRAKNNYVTTLIVNRYALRVINFPRQNLLSCWRPAGGPRPQFHCTNRRKLFLLSKRKHKMASHKKYHQLKIRLQWGPIILYDFPFLKIQNKGPHCSSIIILKNWNFIKPIIWNKIQWGPLIL